MDPSLDDILAEEDAGLGDLSLDDILAEDTEADNAILA